MFEVGFTEIVLILGLALLVLGPEKLPGLAQKIGRWTGRARSMARQLRTQLEQEVTLDELAKSRPMQSPSSTAPSSTAPSSTDKSTAATTVTADPAPEHRTGPQEAQPYPEPHSGPESGANDPVSGIEPPSAPAGPTETATVKDGQ